MSLHHRGSSPVPPIVTRRLHLASVPPPFIGALLDGRRDDAEAIGGFSLPPHWPFAGDDRWLRRWLDQMRADPAVQPWLLRAMVLPRSRRMVGHGGFHGPPDDGRLDLGYTVMPEQRRRGYAYESALALMEWAAREHGVRRFRLSIAPDNAPSLALAARMGFREGRLPSRRTRRTRARVPPQPRLARRGEVLSYTRRYVLLSLTSSGQVRP
ncbi:MAG: GNAT family N-acetyltransferase [Chloroflexi bacterium]|nr:GNAT family N-acetyltransferase [Chloroflexota bacterium]